MAKLEGVRTIDMVNGEITKISYNGAEYVKVDGKPSEEVKVGDIALCSDKRTIYFSEKSYYIAEVRGNSNVLFNDNLDELTGFSDMDSRVTLFRKVEVQAPTIESLSEKVDGLAERVTALEGDKQALSPAKVEQLKVGDYAVHEVDGWFKRGTIVKITELGGWCGSNDSRLLVSDGEKELSVFKTCLRKATDEEVTKAKAEKDLAEKDAVFTRLGRKPGEFKKGDIVRVHDNDGYSEADGRLLTVESHRYGASGGNTHFSDFENIILADDLQLIAPVESRVDAS